jgi:tRNA nucleotidyltransferase (CCA-adding enzyme)
LVTVAVILSLSYPNNMDSERIIPIPAPVDEVLLALTTQGYEAYIVGGCVRDHLLALPVSDWDVTTDATPEEVMACFPRNRILDYGLKHNTLAVLSDAGPIEITTFRYKNMKNKSGDLLRQDLKRRDFTVNALAYHPDCGLIDYFNGKKDLGKKILRCVVNANSRFREDPVRIMRALRMAAVKGFTIHSSTRTAMLNLRELLNTVAQERITKELLLFLTGTDLKKILMEYREVFAVILPEIVPSFDFSQHNAYHCFDVWEHTAESVDAVTTEAVWPLHPGDIPQLRLTMLLHDLGKPACWSMDDKGTGHFYGHPKVSAALAEKSLKRLKVDNKTRLSVTSLVKIHDNPLPDCPAKVRQWLRNLGATFGATAQSAIASAYLLLHIKKADILAQHPNFRSRLAYLERLHEFILTVQDQVLCFTVGDLNISGKKLIEAGIPEGPQIRSVLNILLAKVIEGNITNDEEELLTEVRKLRDAF